MRIELQLKVVRGITHQMREEHRKIQCETLELLVAKLRITITSIESTMTDHGSGDQEFSVRRIKYAFKRQNIDNMIEELKEWQSIFDPSWYLIMSCANTQVDGSLRLHSNLTAVDSQEPVASAQSLRAALNSASNEINHQSVLLPEGVLETFTPRHISLCSALFGQRTDTGESIVLERVEPLQGANVQDLKRDVRDLVRRLTYSNALEFSLLNCAGYIQHRKSEDAREANAFTIIFRVPSGLAQPQSLRTCLDRRRYTDSLSDRFKLAKELAKAVHYVHLFGFVHKNIRPETILLFADDKSLGSAYLVGFDSFRMASGKTLKKGATSWERCLYQHPNRIGNTVTEDYVMQHDIYSLGVCLLEIGLWESFMLYEDKNSTLSSHSVHPVRASVLGTSRSLWFQENLLSLARNELPRKMGTRYMDVVLTCLTCMDTGNANFGEESDFEDADGIEIGVRYIEKVRTAPMVSNTPFQSLGRLTSRLNRLLCA